MTSQNRPFDYKSYHGNLHAFFETGTEGFIWVLIDDSAVAPQNSLYDHTHLIEEGDHLTILKKEGHDILWSGKVEFEYNSSQQPHPYNPGYKQQTALGYWINGLPVSFDVDEKLTLPPEIQNLPDQFGTTKAKNWTHVFLEEYKAILSKPIPSKVKQKSNNRLSP